MQDHQLKLRPTETLDLEHLFLFQLDKQANHLAAFCPQEPMNKLAYIEKYERLLNDPTVNQQTLILDGKIVGSISKFDMEGKNEITYWIDRAYWGKGIATLALRLFLKLEKSRPIFGRVAYDNFGSQKVLENSGFVKIGTDKGFAHARQEEIEEYIYRFSD